MALPEEKSPDFSGSQGAACGRARWLPWSERLVRWPLALLFLWAGVLKLSDPDAFAVLIDAFGILPHWALKYVAIVLPTLEAVAALGLLAGRRMALHMVTALLVLFLSVLLYGIHAELDVDCGCFGPTDPEWRAGHGLKHALQRDLVMAVGVAWLYWLGWRKNRSLEKGPAP